MSSRFEVSEKEGILRVSEFTTYGRVHVVFKEKCHKVFDLLECLRNMAINATYPIIECCEMCKREKEAIDQCIHKRRDLLCYIQQKWLRHLAFYECLGEPTYYKVPRVGSVLESVRAEEEYDHFQPFKPFEDESVLVTEEVDGEIVLKEKRDWYLLELELDTSDKSRGEHYNGWLVKVFECQKHCVVPIIDDKGDLVCLLPREGPSDLQYWSVYVRGGRSICLRLKNWDYILKVTLKRVPTSKSQVPIFVNLIGHPGEVILKDSNRVETVNGALTPVLSMLQIERNSYALDYTPYADSVCRTKSYN